MLQFLLYVNFVKLIVSEYVEFAVSPDFDLGWEIKGDIVEFTYICRLNGWCGFGFGPDMQDVDMITAILMDGKVSVWDTWSLSDSEPPMDTDLDGTDDITIIESTLDPSKGYTVKFSRPLNTGDQFDKTLIADMTLDICWGTYNKESYGEHNEYGDGKMTFGTTLDTSSLTTQSSDDDYDTHGAAMTIMWAILAPLSVLFARYFRHTIWWIWVHLVLGLIPIIVTIISIMAVYKENEGVYDTFDEDKRTHSRLGLVMFVLLIALPVLGGLSAYDMWRRKSIYRMSVMRTSHAVIGRAMLIAGFYNCFIGWDISGSGGGEVFVIIATVVMCVSLLIFEIRLQIASYFPYSKFDFRFDCSRIEDMNHAQVLESVFKDNQKYAFCDELVLDLKGFVNLHPGGAFLLKDAYGEDLGKYMAGCSSYGGDYFPYTHTLRAYDMVRRLAIGKLEYPKSIMMFKDKSDGDFESMDWEMVAKIPIAKDTYLFKFVSSQVEILRYNFPVEMIGKHFRIDTRMKLELISRYYSIMFVDLAEWKQLLVSKNKDLKFAAYDEKSGKGAPLKGKTMDMIIKIYPNGKLTQYIDKLEIGQQLSFKGPFGPGLAITRDFCGPCAAFGAGTGVIPFLDLAYKLWEWNSIDGSLQPNITLFLYVSFRSTNDSFAVDILRACAMSTPSLKLHIKIDDDPQSQGVITKEKLSSISISTIQRVWVCGPSGFNRWICDLVLDEKVPREKIFLL